MRLKFYWYWLFLPIIFLLPRENYHQQIISASDEIKEFDIAIKELFDKLDKAEIFEKVKHRGNIANYTLKYCMSAIYHNPVILAITSLSKSFSPKYLLFNL